ncbi:MAG: MFS transporter [Rhodospirillales bacterium]|nr:MFS transporter [Rhodospirillales bacterium]
MSSGGLQRVVGVFRHRDYTIYTAGNSLSLIGLWMQRIGVGWLTWELTHSPTWLGIIAMAEFFPVVVMGPIGGVLADRFDRASNMIIFQSVAMTASAGLFLLVWSGLINIWLLSGLTLAVGIASGLNSASRLALAPSLVPKDDLTTAIAMNSMVFNTARFIGPAIAGVVINLWGVEFAFACNALSYLTLIWALWSIRSKLRSSSAIREIPGNILFQIYEGIAIVFTNRGSRTVMLMMLATAILLRPIVQLLPGIADEILKSGVNGFAYLTASIGGGAIVGGYWMAQRSSPNTFNMALVGILISLLANAGLLTAESLVSALPYACALGAGMVITGIGIQSTLQMSTPEKMRGRVLSLYGICFMGGPALGALIMGALAEVYGFKPPIFAASLVIFVLWTWIWPSRRKTEESLKRLRLANPE